MVIKAVFQLWLCWVCYMKFYQCIDSWHWEFHGSKVSVGLENPSNQGFLPVKTLWNLPENNAYSKSPPYNWILPFRKFFFSPPKVILQSASPTSFVFYFLSRCVTYISFIDKIQELTDDPFLRDWCLWYTLQAMVDSLMRECHGWSCEKPFDHTVGYGPVGRFGEMDTVPASKCRWIDADRWSRGTT